MLIIQGTERSKSICGLREDGVVEEVKGLLCARKHVIDDSAWKQLSRAEHLFAFVSSPSMYRQDQLRTLVKAWCHGFRQPDEYLPKDVPRIMMPESDFMDPGFVKSNVIKEIPKYDYFYYTCNSKAGIDHKGLNVFFESLPILNRYKLKGIVIVYYPNAGIKKRFDIRMSKRHKKYLSKYTKGVDFYWGLLNSKKMNQFMQNCKFGFFPNTVDNSPRLISEALIRNRPILVNKDIHGGWHYAVEHSGCLFDMKSLPEKIEKMMYSQFYPRDYYMSRFGFKNSSKRLSDFISRVFGIQDYTHMYFHDFDVYLNRIYTT